MDTKTFSKSLAAAWFLLIASATSAASQEAVEYLRNVQGARKQLYDEVRDGIVRVQLVHNDVPSWVLLSLERCAHACRFNPWKRGEISDEEADHWQTWCESFLTHTENHLKTASFPNHGRLVNWKAYLSGIYQDWLNEMGSQAAAHEDSLKHFSGKLRERLEEMAQELSEIENHLPEDQPLVIDQCTGFLVQKGLVVTTHDVTRNRNRNEWVRVWSDRLVNYSTGEVVGTDSETNLALIRLASPGASLEPTIKFVSNLEPDVGDFVFSFFHAFNQDISMRMGEVTGVLRKLPHYHCAAFFETSLPTNPGTLGAPLVNLEGELLGMEAVYMGQEKMSEITYGLPASVLLTLVDQLSNQGYVERGRLGVFVDDYHCPKVHGRRVVVRGVVEGSPADLNGIREGDFIIGVNGNPIDCRMQLIANLAKCKAFDTVRLEIERDGSPDRLELQLAPLALSDVSHPRDQGFEDR